MKKTLVLIGLLTTLSFWLMADTDNATLQGVLFEGTSQGLQLDKPLLRGDASVVFSRYNKGVVRPELDRLAIMTKDGLDGIRQVVSTLPAPRNYDDDIAALRAEVDTLSSKLEEANRGINRIQRRDKIDYTGQPLEDKIIQEWDSPWYASVELLNAAGQSQQGLEAGYRFRFLDPDYTASVIPVARYANGTLFMGARAEVRW